MPSPSAGPVASPPVHSPQGPFLAYARLLRLPNVFTAMADICLGALATGALPGQGERFLWLLLASSCLYLAGMVWNDFFDLEQDRRERPFRPLPSGKIRPRTAAGLGTFLLLAGVACAGLADRQAEGLRWHSLALALGLAAAILLYDGWLKRTWAGPLGMGACRSLNVLLGLSVYPEGVGSWGLFLALVVGLYIVGVTWFARTEARLSNQKSLLAAAGVMLLAVLLSLALPVLGGENDPEPTTSPLFPYLVVLFLFYVGAPVSRAIARPVPDRVQAAVKRSVLGLVIFDAILATALAGTMGLVIAALLLPAFFLGRWVYST